MLTAVKTNTSIVIPARPDVLVNLTDALQQKDPDFLYIAYLIKQDVALYTSVLSNVNSAYYGLSSEVTSIERAISLLGLDRIFKIVQLAALKNSLPCTGPLERFWDTATEVAHISAILAQQFGKVDPDEAYTLGMLHDTGIPILLRANPHYKDFLKKCGKLSIQQVKTWEISTFGVDHYELASELAKQWNISATTVEALKRQPNYQETFQEPSDNHEQMRLSLCILLLARDISDAYRYFWRIPDAEDSFLNIQPILMFLGISEYEYADLKEDITQALYGYINSN